MKEGARGAAWIPSQALPVPVPTWWTFRCKRKSNLNLQIFMQTRQMAWDHPRTRHQSALEVFAHMKDHQRTLIAAKCATTPTPTQATFTDTMSRPICKGTPIHARFATRNSIEKTTWPLTWGLCTVGVQEASRIPPVLEATVSRWRQIFLVFLHWCQARVVHVYLHLTIIKNICHLFKIKFPMNKLHNMREQAIIILLQQKILFKAVCALCIRCNNTWLLFVLGNLYSKSELPRLLFIIIGQLWFKFCILDEKLERYFLVRHVEYLTILDMIYLYTVHDDFWIFCIKLKIFTLCQILFYFLYYTWICITICT